MDKKGSGVNSATIKLLKLVSANKPEISLWLMALAFTNSNMSTSTIANNPCKTLMNKGFDFDDITDILKKLVKSGMMIQTGPFGTMYALSDTGTYRFRCLLNDMDRTITHHPSIEKISKECGFKENLFSKFIKSFNNSEASPNKLAKICINNAVPFSNLFFRFFGS